MSKLKKSIKAIIISICAVVVLAGSIVGVVLANKNKSDGTPSNDGGLNTAAVCNLTDAQKKLSKKINESNNSNFNTFEKYDYSKFYFEDDTQVDFDLIEAIYENYFTYTTVYGKTIYVKSAEVDGKVYFKEIFEILEIDETLEFEAILEVNNNYAYGAYAYHDTNEYVAKRIVLDLNDISNISILKTFELASNDLTELATNVVMNTSILLNDSYFVNIEKVSTLSNLQIYDYSGTNLNHVENFESFDDKKFEDNYFYYVISNNACFGGFVDNEFKVYTFEEDNESLYTYSVSNNYTFIEKVSLAEVGDANAVEGKLYGYSRIDMKTGEMVPVELEEGYTKATFSSTDLDGHYYVYMQKANASKTDFETSGLMVYYNETREVVLKYSTSTIEDKVVLIAKNNFVTKYGIYIANKTVETTKVKTFETGAYFVEDSVNDSTFVVYDGKLYYIYDIDGNKVFEKGMGLIHSYSNGIYFAYEQEKIYCLNVNSKTITEISDFVYDAEQFNMMSIMYGGGYYFTDNANDNNYSMFDYSNNLIYDNVVSFEIVDKNTSYVDVVLDSGKNFTIVLDSLVYVADGVYIEGETGVEPYTDTSGTNWSSTGGEEEAYSWGVVTASNGKYVSSGRMAWKGSSVGAVFADSSITFTYDYNSGTVSVTDKFAVTRVLKQEASVNGSEQSHSITFDADYYYNLVVTKYYDGLGGFAGMELIELSDLYSFVYDHILDSSKDYSEANNKDNYKENGSYETVRYGGTFSLTGSLTCIGGSLSGYSALTTGTPTFSASLSSGTKSLTNDKLYTSHKRVDWHTYAYYIPNTYTITYSLVNGTAGSYAPTNLTYGSEYTISNPTKLGYTFAGWSISNMTTDCTHYWNGSGQGKGGSATGVKATTKFKNLRSTSGAVTFLAVWTANTYKVEYVLDGGTAGSHAPTDFAYGPEGGTYDKTISNPTKVGYTFTGWTIENMSTDCRHCWGGYAHGSNEKETGIMAETGYLNLRSTSGTVTFTATWKNNTYTIAYELNGGNHGTNHPTSATYGPAGGTYDRNISNPTRTGYTFTGWSISNMSTNCTHWWGGSNQGSAENAYNVKATTGFLNLRSKSGEVKFTANWSANEYTIKFNLNNPNSVTNDISSTGWGDVKVKYDADKQLTGTPTKTGYIFSHWSVSDMDESSSVTGEIVTHFYGDATSSYVDFTGTTLNDVTLPRYFKNLRSTSGTVTFKANWTPITYNLTYDANNGVFADGVSNPSSARYDQAFNVTTPIRHGYNFTKWTIKVGTATGTDYTLTANYPNSATEEFINRTTTNGATVKFTANWTAITYTIAYNLNNPNSVTNDISSFSSTTGTYNTWKNISKPVKVGYLFDYWEITGTSSCNHKANCACFASADNGTCSHYYNTTNSDSGATRFTGTSLASTTATYFKNLHCTSGNTVTFKAHWVKKTYNVINAGSTYGATISTEYPKFDEVFSMEAPTSAPIGYHFDGWTITGANNKDENMTSYTVTHYYGTTNAASSTFTGTSKTVGSTVMFFKNLSSNNWTSASSTNAIVTITPVWTANTYTVTYNMNNPNRLTSDISSYSNTTATYDTAFSKSNPVKAGYTFTGWALSGLTDDCPHYYGTSSSSMTAFESNNNAYKDSETAQYVLLKSTYYKNLRSGSGTATLKANWRANTYTITYHYIPASFNVANYNASQLFTHINIAGNMTSTITETVTYDTKYEALNCKTELDEVVFPLPVGLKFKLWSISSSALSSSTSVAKYSGNVVVTALSDSIQPFEERVYGPGKASDGALTWKHYSTNIHLYACYDLAGINLRYYGPSAASGENDLSKYSNLSAVNTNVKYTELIRFASSSAVVDGSNLMGWMISADYLSDGRLTEHSITIFEYKGSNYIAYQGTQAYWNYTNVDAYSYEDPTYFLYAIYSNEYSGTTNALVFTYRDNTSGSLGSYFSPKFYSVKGTNDGLTSVKIPKYYNDGTHGFLPVEHIEQDAFKSYTSLVSANWFNSMRSIGNYAFNNCTALTTFTLNAGLHTIHQYAFSGCTARTSLLMPSTLRVIEDYAFKDCTNVSTLSLNEGLLTIDEYAFNNLSKVTSLTLPSTLVGEIGDYAFFGMQMASITIPKGVTVLGYGSFEDCTKLATVTFATGSSLRTIEGSAFNEDAALTTISVPNSVTFIGDYAFYICSKLETITLPDSLSTLGNAVFYNCAALTAITIPKNLTSIPVSTFNGCSKLASVTIYSGITFIGTSAFRGCSSLTNLTIPNTVTSIGSAAFYGCSKLATLSIPFVGLTRTTGSTAANHIGYVFGTSSSSNISSYIPSSLKKIYVTDASKIDAKAFYNCSNLTHLYINKGVASMGQNAFYGCSALTELSVPFVGTSASDTTNCYLGYFFGQTTANSSSSVPTTLKTVHVTNATTIGSCAFYMSSVTTVNLNEGITAINSYAFQHTKLTGITFPRTLTSIGEAAFANVGTLTSANFNEGLTSIGNYAFNVTKLTTVVIPQSVTSIGQYAFNGITTLTTLTLFDGLTSMGVCAFSGCSALTAVKIPRTVTSIPDSCFYNCTSLASVTLPNTITSIIACAFYNCTALTSITIPSSVTTIGNYAFEYSGLTSIYIPDSVTCIGIECFAHCTSLASVRLSNNLTAIPNDAFYGAAISRIEIPASVTTVGMNAFYNCANLTDVLCYGAIEDFAVNTAYPAFNHCSGLTYFYYGGTEDYFYSYPMYEWNYEEDSLTGYNCYPNMIFNFDHMQFTYHSVTYSYSFKSKGTIGSNDYMYIPSTYNDGINGRRNVTVIEENAFYNQTSMPEAILPSTITTIGAYAFYGCSAMTYSNMPTSIQVIGANAYRGCTAMAATFTIPDAVSHIDDYTFYNCQRLGVKFNSTSTLKYIGYYAFYYLSLNATSARKYIMQIPNGVTYIGEGAFHSSYAFTGDLKLPSGLLYLGPYAFYDNNYITRVEIPRTLDALNERVFYSCADLKVVYIPDTIKSIPTRSCSYGPFYGCGPNYTTAPSLSIYLEGESIPSGWGKYWNSTYSTTKKANTFYNYPAMPNAYLSNANTSYYLTQDSEGVFKVNLTTKVSQSNNPGLVISAQYFVNVRFEYMIYSKNVDVDMCVEINGSEYPVSLLGSQTTTYQYYSRLLKPGDVMKILLGNHKCAASYACGMYVKNLRIEPIENFGGFDFGMSGDTLYSTNDGVDGNYNIDGDYYNEYNDGEYWMDYYGEYAGLEHYSASGFTYYATDYCEVSFGYNSFSERDYDYVRAVVNGSLEVVADVECYGGNYNRILNPGDYITIYYRKDVSVGTDEGYEDIGYIENFYIAKIQEWTFETVDAANKTGYTSPAYKNATVAEGFDMIGQWTTINVNTYSFWECLYKPIITKKYNATMRFVLYWQSGNTTPLYQTTSAYSQTIVGPILQVTSGVPTNYDNISQSVAYGCFLPQYYKCSIVTLTIPNPGSYYICINFGGLTDGYNSEFDFYCLDSIGVNASVGTYSHHDSAFDKWDSTSCSSLGTGFSSRSYNASTYYNDVKGGDFRLRSGNKNFDGTSSTIQYVAPADGLVTFDYSIESENSYDGFHLYLNNGLLMVRTEYMSGSYAVSMKKGDILKFLYHKDSSYSEGNDAVDIYNFHFKKCYIFKQSGETYVPTNLGAQNSEAVYVIHAGLSNYGYCQNDGISYNYYMEIGVYVEISHESIHDRVEIYDSWGNLLYTTANKTGTSGSFNYYLSGDVYDCGDYLLVKYVKDGSIDSSSEGSVNIRVFMNAS